MISSESIVMGDKSPRSTKKRDSQRQSKSADAKQKKEDIQQAKRVTPPKK